MLQDGLSHQNLLVDLYKSCSVARIQGRQEVSNVALTSNGTGQVPSL